MNLNQLDKIEDKLNQIREMLNPEDSPYICDTIVTSVADEELSVLVTEMMIRMGYKKKTIERVLKIVKNIQR